jgi:hypothetical protein
MITGVGVMTGCTGLRVPSGLKTPSSLSLSQSNPQIQPPLAANSVAQAVYQATRQAKANKGIVLQVVGDENPIRVLPLPGEGQSVYVSQLLTQSGVLQQLGAVEATLFRHSTGSIGGVPMECKMAKGGQQVMPESDYALQAGDRLRVRKAELFGGADLFDLVLQR